MERSLFDKISKLDREYWPFYAKGLFIRPYLEKTHDKKILDAGCGTGPMLDFLRRWGEVVAMDPSDYALSLANRHHAASGIEFITGDAGRIPFPDASFDVVTLFDVLYHKGVEDDEAVVRECYRVLKDGGTVIISDSAFKFLKTTYDNEAHVARRYTLSEMKRKLKASGFKVRKASYIFFFIFPVVAAARILKNLVSPNFRETDHVFRLHPFINKLMKRIMYIEAMLVRVVNLPFGVSVFCVGEKRA